jgi:hypothetical protein
MLVGSTRYSCPRLWNPAALLEVVGSVAGRCWSSLLYISGLQFHYQQNPDDEFKFNNLNKPGLLGNKQCIALAW